MGEKKSMEDMMMRQYEIQRQYQESQRGLYQQRMNPGMMTQGQSMASAGGGYMEHIHRHHGHGPLATVAANQVGNTLGPGMASNMVTQGTSAGVGVTQGVTNAGMGAIGF